MPWISGRMVELIPIRVEEVLAVGPAHYPLAGGLGQSAPAQDQLEFLLRQRMNSAGGVRDGLLDQRMVCTRSSPGERLSKATRHRDTLLHRSE